MIMAPVRIGHIRYIHILTCLRGFRVKIANIYDRAPENVPQAGVHLKAVFWLVIMALLKKQQQQ